jgi:D-alanyl-D-alanine dipeptidase
MKKFIIIPLFILLLTAFQNPAIASDSVFQVDHLARIKDLDPTIVIDLRYATENNFTGKKVYPTAKGILRYETAKKLAKANADFRKDGYTIKVWDGYRPIYVQKIFWNILPDDRYVANPYKGGSRHNRGGAVDVTLIDRDGKELEMPSGFDDFSSKAWPNNFAMTTEAKKNVGYLRRVMLSHGFTPLEHEWWHFDDKDWRNFPLVDVDLDKF